MHHLMQDLGAERNFRDPQGGKCKKVPPLGVCAALAGDNERVDDWLPGPPLSLDKPKQKRKNYPESHSKIGF